MSTTRHFTYTWTIPDYWSKCAHHSTFEPIKLALNTDYFYPLVGENLECCLELWPTGRDVKSEDFVAVFFWTQLCQLNTEARYEISILDVKGEKCEVKENQAKLVRAKGTGWKKFISRDYLKKHENRLVPFDRLTLFCEVWLDTKRQVENMILLTDKKDLPRKVPTPAQQVALNFDLELHDNKQVEPPSLNLYPFVNDPLNVELNFRVATVPEVHFSVHKHTLNIDIVFFNHSKGPFMYRLKLFDESGNICFHKDNRVELAKNNRINELLRKPLGREYKKCKLTGIFELANYESGLNRHHYNITIRRDLHPVIRKGAIQNINLRFKDCAVKTTNCIVAGSGNTFGNINMQNVVQQKPQQLPQPQQKPQKIPRLQHLQQKLQQLQQQLQEEPQQLKQLGQQLQHQIHQQQRRQRLNTVLSTVLQHHSDFKKFLI